MEYILTNVVNTAITLVLMCLFMTLLFTAIEYRADKEQAMNVLRIGLSVTGLSVFLSWAIIFGNYAFYLFVQ